MMSALEAAASLPGDFTSIAGPMTTEKRVVTA